MDTDEKIRLLYCEDQKTCSRCGATKDMDQFAKHAASKDGLQSACKECGRQWYRENRERHRENSRRAYVRNRDAVLARGRRRREEKPEEWAAPIKAWKDANKARTSETNREWYAKNREKAQAKNRKWIQDNAERHRFLTRRWYEENPDRVRDARRLWEQSNPALVQGKRYRRRARLLANEVFEVAVRDTQRLLSARCFACGSDEDMTIDHVVPIARGGRHSVGNLLPLCRSCNSSKRDQTWMEWRVQRQKKGRRVA